MPDFLVERLLSFRRVGRGSATLTLGSPPERWFLRSWPSRAFRLGLLPLTRIPGHRAFPRLPSLEWFGRPRELRVVPLPNSIVILADASLACLPGFCLWTPLVRWTGDVGV